MFDVKFTIDKKGTPENLSRGCVTVEVDLIEMASSKAKSKIINENPLLGLSESNINVIQITSPSKMKEFLAFNYQDFSPSVIA